MAAKGVGYPPIKLRERLLRLFGSLSLVAVPCRDAPSLFSSKSKFENCPSGTF